MKHLWYVVVCLMLLASCQSKQESESQTQEPVAAEPEPPYVERSDPLLDQVISPNTEVEILAEGFDWSEGPLWLEAENMLIFSDIPPNMIYSWNEEQGKKEYVTPSGYTGEAERGGEVGSKGL